MAVGPVVHIHNLTAQTIASTGVAQKLSATEIAVVAVTIHAPSSNATDVYVGGSTVTSANGHILTPGQSISWGTESSKGMNELILLNDIYINGTNPATVRVTYWQRVDR